MKVLVTGASGQLGRYVLALLKESDHEVRAWSGSRELRVGSLAIEPVDLRDGAGIRSALEGAAPEAILHLAALSRVGEAYWHPTEAIRINAEATEDLADWAEAHGARLVAVSTDLVFDGRKPWYREGDEPRPISVYGQTKRAGELTVFGRSKQLVARLGLLYGPSLSDRPTTTDQLAALLRDGETPTAFEDEFRTPLDYRTAASILLRLLERPELEGILHVAGPRRLSRFQLARRLAEAMGFDPSAIRPNRQADVASEEPRPPDVSLITDRLAAALPDCERPPVEEGLKCCLEWKARSN